MTPEAAGYIVGFVIGLAVVLAIGLPIGALVLKLACHICGERDVTFPHAMAIVFVNWLAQMCISAVVNFGIIPQLELNVQMLIGLYLGTVVVNMLVASTIISSMVPTTFPKAIAIWLMNAVVVIGFILIVFLVLAVAGVSLLPKRPGSGTSGASTVVASVPEDVRFLTVVLEDLKSLEGFDGGGRVVSIPSPARGGGAVDRPPTRRGGAGGPAESRFPRPGAGSPGSSTPQILIWQVKPDPPAEVVEIPADKPVRIPVPPNFFKGNDALFPTTASPFVSVGKNRGDDNVREVWDLRTRRRAGRLPGKIDLDEKLMALSPDGQSLAGKAGFKNSAQVWSIATGRPLLQVDLGNASPDVFDFAGPDRLVVGSTRGKVLEVWDIKAGQKLHSLQIPSPFDRDAVAISPGARYLAATFKDDTMLRVYDLETGQVAGEETLPKEGPFGWTGQGMAFSPDGSELAAVLESFGKVRILCWNVADGSIAADFRFDDQSGVKRAFGYEDRGIQWIPGLNAWLLFGESVIDRKTGQKVHTFPFDRQDFQPGPRRPLSAGRMLIVFGNRTRTVVGAEIPQEVVKALGVARVAGPPVDARP